MMSRATYPAAARLHRPTEFAAALSGRRIARGVFFVVTAHSRALNEPEATSEPLCARLGLIMAKRFAQHASTRNALKRVVREAFRAKRMELPPNDFVVRLHKRIASMSLTEIKLAARKEADAHFLRAQQ
jgi:ribonuclease P protein component